MDTIEQAEHDVFLRKSHINVFKAIASYFSKYKTKNNRVEVTLLSTTTDGGELLVCYVQFDPKQIDAEKALYNASSKTYSVDDQVFIALKCLKDDIYSNMVAIRNYIEVVLHDVI